MCSLESGKGECPGVLFFCYSAGFLLYGWLFRRFPDFSLGVGRLEIG